MKLYDYNDDRAYSLSDLKREYLQFSREDPYNHAGTFTADLFEILMATVNGRNDCDVVGMTPDELCNYIVSLRKKVL